GAAACPRVWGVRDHSGPMEVLRMHPGMPGRESGDGEILRKPSRKDEAPAEAQGHLLWLVLRGQGHMPRILPGLLWSSQGPMRLRSMSQKDENWRPKLRRIEDPIAEDYWEYITPSGKQRISR